MEQAGAPVDTLAALKALGVRLLLDDFGTGYSSLGYLATFPIDTLKLDRSFVTGMATNRAKAAIVAAVTTMAHALELEVIAEGIETVEQRARLQELGCHEGQGYLFSRALPAASLSAVLRRGRVESSVFPVLTVVA
jgi:EAL domain-containing protein (putative c-di-GMP-specific phosphodiesterase class I)